MVRKEYLSVQGVDKSDSDKDKYLPVEGVDNSDKDEYLPVEGVDNSDKDEYLPVEGVDNSDKDEYLPVEGVDNSDKDEYLPGYREELTLLFGTSLVTDVYVYIVQNLKEGGGSINRLYLYQVKISYPVKRKAFVCFNIVTAASFKTFNAKNSGLIFIN